MRPHLTWGRSPARTVLLKAESNIWSTNLDTWSCRAAEKELWQISRCSGRRVTDDAHDKHPYAALFFLRTELLVGNKVIIVGICDEGDAVVPHLEFGRLFEFGGDVDSELFEDGDGWR